MELTILKENVFEKSKEGVYLIRNLDNGLLKIGKTNNFKRRFNEIINNFNFCGIEPKIQIEAFINYYDETKLESYLHKTFKSCRVKNEWFDIENKDIIFESLKNFDNVKDNKSKSYKNSYLSLNDLIVWAYLSSKRKKIYGFNYVFNTMNSEYDVTIEGYLPTLYDFDVAVVLMDDNNNKYSYRGIANRLKLSSFGNATKIRIKDSLMNMCDTKVIIKDSSNNILYDFYIIEALDIENQIIHFDGNYISLVKSYVKNNAILESYLALKYSCSKKLLMFISKYNNKHIILDKDLLYKFLNNDKRIKDSDLHKYFDDLMDSKFIESYEVFDRYIKIIKM